MEALNNSWPEPWNSAANLARESRDQAGAQHAARDAEATHSARRAHALGGGQHDADDQAGLDDFAKDDEKAREHATYSAITTPCAVSE